MSVAVQKAPQGMEGKGVNHSSGRRSLLIELGMQSPSSGVDTGEYLSMIDDTISRQENYLNASQEPGARGNEDHAYFGRMEFDRQIITEKGYDHQGSTSDQNSGLPDQATVRNMIGAYATKHGFHVGWDPHASVEGEVEHAHGTLPPVKEEEDALSAPITEHDALGVNAHAFGMDGTQVYGYSLADSDAVDFLAQAHHSIGADDMGHARAGAAQFGWMANRWMGTAYSQANDGGRDQRLAVDEGDWMAESMDNADFESTAAQKHQMVTSEGFRNLNNDRGSLASEMHRLGYTKDGGYTGRGPSNAAGGTMGDASTTGSAGVGEGGPTR